jgi:FtsP/CotA-like multicopper oxidase with cupredoxin domain
MKQNISTIHTWKPVFIFGLSVLLLSISGYKKNFGRERDSYLITRNEIISCPPAINQTPTDLEEVTINSNQRSAGEFRNGIYYIHLEAREGYWYPETKEGAPVKITAFAEAGKQLQVPGPLIRVPEGAVVKVSVRNSTNDAINLYGFITRLYRPANYKEDMTINKGETKEITFNAGDPGTFFYTAKNNEDTLTPAQIATPFLNSQLYGAFIIDSNNEKIDLEERIFMIGMCGFRNGDAILTKYVINGLTWPYTERLTYRQGEKVNWRVINASVLNHPMHLHGFPFVTKSFVFAAKDSVIPVEKRKEAVTQNLVPMNRIRMTWVPEKEGNWLFHCHLLDHSLPASFFKAEGQEDHTGMNTQTHARQGMGGLVMGIHVSPDKKYAKNELTKKPPERKLMLLVGEQPQNYSHNKSGKGFQLLEKGKIDSGKYSIPGPPIVLIKNQPTAITIINNLKEPTTIHWHGLEIESYYDGVAGWGNMGSKLAPLIQPGDSFTVHITPPRAGTFMYHTHMHDRQLLDGLYGALIVLNPGEKYTPETDKIFLLSQGNSNIEFTKNWFTGFSNLLQLLNGSNQPGEIHLKKGIKYRLRVINISAQENSYQLSPRDGFFISLKKDDKPVVWKSIDKDGMNIPARMHEIIPADNQRAAPGTTHDFQFTPGSTGEYHFEAKFDQKVMVRQLIKVSE